MAPPEDLWACPVSFPTPEATSEGEALRQQIAQEIRMLGPWYEEGRKQRGRTTVGISGKGAESINEMASIIATYGAGEEIDSPEGFAFEWPKLLRYLTDDIRAYYFEAAASQPGSAAPTPDELNEWLYRQTTFGDLLYRCRDRMRGIGRHERTDEPSGVIPDRAACDARAETGGRFELTSLASAH